MFAHAADRVDHRRSHHAIAPRSCDHPDPAAACEPLAPAAVRGVLGFPGGRVLLPGVRGAVHAAGGSLVRGAAGLAGDRAAGGALPQAVRRACSCRVQATVMAPGPPKAVGKGLFSNGFIAMLLTERYVAGRSQNSLVTGLARQGAEISPATLAGTCAQAGTLLAPLADAITARSRDSWHLHADETTWRVFAPRDGGGRRNGGYGCSSARTPAASSWIPPVPGRCWPVTPGSTRRPGS